MAVRRTAVVVGVVLCVSLFLNSANASLTLTGTCYPCSSTTADCCQGDAQTQSGLRDEGDVWQPSQPGLNSLRCGDPFMKDPDEDRLVVAVGDEFKVLFNIVEARGGGEVTLRMKYGANPDFYYGVGFKLADTFSVEPDSDASQVELSALISKEYGYNTTATVEVAFISNEGAVLIQCIDIDARSDRLVNFVIPPHGYGDPEYNPEDVYAPQKLSVNLDKAETLSTFHIILIILIIVLVFAFFVLWIKYKGRKGVETELGDPIMAVDEAIQAPVKPDSEPEPTISSSRGLEPPASEQEAEGIIEMSDVAKSPAEEPEVDPNDGSAGRHFHFRYVDDDDDKS